MKTSVAIIIYCILLPFMSMAKEDANYYRLKLLVQTTSGWTTIKPLPPWDKDWHIQEIKIIKPDKKQDLINVRNLSINQPSLDGSVVIIEYIIYFKAQSEDMEFIITRGDIGSTEVKVFNMCSDKEYRIGKYTSSLVDGSGKNPAKYRMPFRKIDKFGTVDFMP